MNHIPFTLTAYFLNALAVLTNKFLLNKTIPDPLIYVFYISLVSFLAILALPFTHIPSLEVFTTASFSTLLWTLGAYFMFKALKMGLVDRVIPIIATLIPLILLAVASQANAITPTQTLAVGLAVLGMVFLTVTDYGSASFNKQELLWEILSAAFFALSYILLRRSFAKLDFFSVLVWSRLILLPLGIFILTIPDLRRKIITSSLLLSSASGRSIKSGLIFLGGQLSGTASELLLMFSISLANPALVNSLQGIQYVFLLIFSLILAGKYPAIFAEKHTLKALSVKFMGIISIGVGLYLLVKKYN